jgi:hypothetical protein
MFCSAMIQKIFWNKAMAWAERAEPELIHATTAALSEATLIS